jgi:hypothetical protein
MSLINEALKKAQRQRAEEQANLAPPMPGGGSHRVRRSAPALSTQTILLLAGGGIALFVVAVVVTVLWINRPGPAKTGPAKSPLAAVAETTVTAAPMIVLPGSLKAAEPDLSAAPPTSKFNPATSAQNPIQAAPNPGPVTLNVASPPASAALTAEPVPVAPAGVRVTGKFQESIQTLVDALRVTGIRAAGNDSKVMINERVYKLNDIVDRPNSLRLTNVASDGLMFTTPDGVTYEKTF